jgi:hypothetical protein
MMRLRAPIAIAVGCGGHARQQSGEAASWRSGGNYPFLANLRPENCHRAAGGKKLRYVRRSCPDGVAKERPRNTT